MVVNNYVDGDILTAGSLNTTLAQRTSSVEVNATPIGVGSGTGTQTIKDIYVVSGTLPTNNNIFFHGNFQLNGSSAFQPLFSVNIGPSGTTPSLTNIGSLIFSHGVDGHRSAAAGLVCAGSTTVDGATPALMRVSVATARNSCDLMSYNIQGVVR